MLYNVKILWLIKWFIDLGFYSIVDDFEYLNMMLRFLARQILNTFDGVFL